MHVMCIVRVKRLDCAVVMYGYSNANKYCSNSRSIHTLKKSFRHPICHSVQECCGLDSSVSAHQRLEYEHEYGGAIFEHVAMYALMHACIKHWVQECFGLDSSVSAHQRLEYEHEYGSAMLSM